MIRLIFGMYLYILAKSLNVYDVLYSYADAFFSFIDADLQAGQTSVQGS